jgi:hypothetical protein
VCVVAELAKDPVAEHRAEAGLAQVAFSVPVPAKMLGHHLPELLDLGIEGGGRAGVALATGLQRRQQAPTVGWEPVGALEQVQAVVVVAGELHSGAVGA